MNDDGPGQPSPNDHDHDHEGKQKTPHCYTVPDGDNNRVSPAQEPIHLFDSKLRMLRNKRPPSAPP